MIAAVSVKDKVVWGIGESNQAAFDDAQFWMTLQTPEVQKEGFGDLDYVEIEEHEDIDLLDGEALFKFCRFKKPAKPASFQQLNLFDI